MTAQPHIDQVLKWLSTMDSVNSGLPIDSEVRHSIGFLCGFAAEYQRWHDKQMEETERRMEKRNE